MKSPEECPETRIIFESSPEDARPGKLREMEKNDEQPGAAAEGCEPNRATKIPGGHRNFLNRQRPV